MRGGPGGREGDALDVALNLPSLFFGIGAASCAVSVALGAFGAHVLKSRLEPAALSAFETAVHYQFLHSLALCAVALWMKSASTEVGGAGAVAGYAFVAGILLFSGSLYVLALGGPRWLGPVTPLGGLAFIAGWLMLAYDALRRTFAA